MKEPDKDEVKEIEIINLLLDDANPRFLNPVDSQREALLKIVKGQQDKLYNLADIFVEYGALLHENLVVTPKKDEDGKYIVKEGNRRLAALKILLTPQIIETEDARLFQKFNRLHTVSLDKPISKMSCLVTSDEKKIAAIVSLRHNGENDGRGVVEWNTVQKIRNKINNHENDFETRTLNFLISIPVDEETLESLNFTNLTRLMQDKYVQEMIGIHDDKKQITLDTSNKINEAALKQILYDFSGEEALPVKLIYNKSDRKKYIDDVISKIQDSQSQGINQEGKDTSTESHKDLSRDSSRTGKTDSSYPSKSTSGSKDRTNPVSTDRKTVIPTKCKFQIDHVRLNSIYSELRKLHVESYPNACSVLFRVFVELSVDIYCKDKKVTGYGDRIKLKEKIRLVCEDFKAKKYMTDSELKPVNKAFSDDTASTSVGYWHTYIHNSNMNPKPIDIKTDWDNIERFMKILHEKLLEP